MRSTLFLRGISPNMSHWLGYPGRMLPYSGSALACTSIPGIGQLAHVPTFRVLAHWPMYPHFRVLAHWPTYPYSAHLRNLPHATWRCRFGICAISNRQLRTVPRKKSNYLALVPDRTLAISGPPPQWPSRVRPPRISAIPCQGCCHWAILAANTQKDVRGYRALFCDTPIGAYMP